MQDALRADERLAATRDHDPESIPVADAVRRYVDGLDALDLDDCPASFTRALGAHRDAWAALAPTLDAYPDERGEMHDVFARLADPQHNPDHARFDMLVARVWTTWGQVEGARAPYAPAAR